MGVRSCPPDSGARPAVLERWIALDQRWLLRLYRMGEWPALGTACRIASRLGDGVLWYALMLSLPWWAGAAGWRCAQQMVLAALVALGCYLVLKHNTARSRPCHRHPEFPARCRVLDRFSFPSGHTMHAVSFTFVLSQHFPTLAATVMPVTLLIALSRVVLGLHYPSDVLGGAVLGLLVAWLATSIAPPFGDPTPSVLAVLRLSESMR